MERRAFLLHFAVGASSLAVPGLLAACRKTTPATPRSNVPPPFSGLIDEAAEGALPGLNILLAAGEFLALDGQRIPLGLVNPDEKLFEHAAARLWLGRERGVTGPIELTFREFGSGEQHAHAEELGEPSGFYDALAALPEPGVWDLLVRAEGSGGAFYGFAAMQVVGSPKVPAPGQPAVVLKTPTFDDPQGVNPVCTRDPPCPMHAASLDAAIGSRPVVLVVATPKLCTSRMCGPVVNEVVAVHDEAKDRATFVHAEVYRDPAGQQITPTMQAWRLESEPWTFVIDGGGAVRARFEGPVVAAEVREALAGVL